MHSVCDDGAVVQFEFISERGWNEQFFPSLSDDVDIILIDVFTAKNREGDSSISDFEDRFAHGLGVFDHFLL